MVKATKRRRASSLKKRVARLDHRKVQFRQTLLAAKANLLVGNIESPSLHAEMLRLLTADLLVQRIPLVNSVWFTNELRTHYNSRELFFAFQHNTDNLRFRCIAVAMKKRPPTIRNDFDWVNMCRGDWF